MLLFVGWGSIILSILLYIIWDHPLLPTVFFFLGAGALVADHKKPKE